jgi:hypothetical protein
VLRRPKRPDELLVGARPGGIVLAGKASAVERFSARLSQLSSSVGEIAAVAQTVKEAADQIVQAGDGAAKLVELSPRSIALLREHGAIATGDGYFRSMVHDGKSIAGNPDWKQVTSPGEIAQLQSAAVGLALQASIKNLSDAVARVEVKVDVLADLIRAEQFGDVLGHHRVLQRLLDMTSDGSRLSSTDWHSIDQMRVDITSSLERTRMFIRNRMEAAESGRWTRQRADAAEQLIDSGLIDTLGVLAVCEQNLAGWHHLRLMRVETTEPEQLEAVVRDIEGDLALHHKEDEVLATELVELLDGFVDATGFEGFEPIKRRSLKRSVDELRAATSRFIDERKLDIEIGGHGELPGTVASLRVARDRAVDGSRWAINSTRRLVRRHQKSGPPELGPGDGGD